MLVVVFLSGRKIGKPHIFGGDISITVYVLDIMLEDEDVDAWELLKYMKNKEAYKKIPIFISSALEKKKRAIEVGAIEYLVKPYPPSRLSKIIMQTLLNQGQQGEIMIPE
jgi:DNA-binding response OmpR family regulator